jgi:cellulose synthase/poly-beta-1,6-N-acetylglucosamine synthase-like glycosyltransferase
MAYPSFDVIAIDDRSTDETGPIFDELARSLPEGKLKVIHVPHGPLPDGWFGKPHALHLGAKQLDPRTSWLLFVDSDVMVSPDALRQAVALCVNRKYDALSITTNLVCETFVERLVMPLAAGLWVTTYAVSFTNEDSRPHNAYANGQFFLIRREPYEAVGGHASVPATVVEDVELMSRLKCSGARVRFQVGGHLAATRMYRGWEQIRNGWSRTFCGTSRRRPGRLILALACLLTFTFSWFPAAAWSVFRIVQPAPYWYCWVIASAAHAILVALFVGYFYAASGNRRRYALLFPVAAIYLAMILIRAIRLCRTGQVNWRGSTVQIQPA